MLQTTHLTHTTDPYMGHIDHKPSDPTPYLYERMRKLFEGILMEEKPIDQIKLADEAFDQGYFEEAIKLYTQISFHLIFMPDENLSPKTAMKKAVICYQKMNESYAVQEEKDYIQQYFSVVRHWLDHQENTDLDAIKKEIHGDIPLEMCEDREGSLPEGITHHQTHKIGPYDISISTAQGIRDHMEDAHCIKEIELNTAGTHQMHMFCVMDGHGGAACAQYIANCMPEVLSEELKKLPNLSDQHLYNAFVRSCVLIDEHWRNLPFQKTLHKDSSGTTATITCIFDHKTLWVANVGDSGAAIDRKGEAIQLTESAKPTIPKYKDEIFFRGGIISYGRVDASLDMARSIGDLQHPSVSSRPTLKKVTLDEYSKYLVVACDGLWDVIDAQLAMDAIKGKSPAEASEHLRKLAYQRGSSDNVTILVVGLNS